MDCKLKGCDEEATVRALTPYGTANLCAGHGDDLDRGQAVFRGLSEAFQFGPAVDPPLADAARGPERVDVVDEKNPVELTAAQQRVVDAHGVTWSIPAGSVFLVGEGGTWLEVLEPEPSRRLAYDTGGSDS